MSGLRRTSLLTYAKWTVAVAGITLAAGFVLLALGNGSGLLHLVLWAWFIFALCVGVGALLVLLLPAAGAGPLARTTFAVIFLLATLWLQRPMRGMANGVTGPLADLWSTIGDWLSGGLANFDTVSWRVSLAGGVVILFVYPFLRLAITPLMSWAGKLLGSLAREFRAVNFGRDDEKRASRGVEEFFANLSARHFMLLTSALSVSFVILLPPVLLYVDTIHLYGVSKDIFDAGEHIAWVGSLVLVLELTSLTLRDASRKPDPEQTESRSAAPRRRPHVDELYRRLTELAGDHIVYAAASKAATRPELSEVEQSQGQAVQNNGPSKVVFDDLPASATLTLSKINQLRPVVDRFLDPAARAPRIALSESLTSDHYLIFAGFVRHALDNGGTVLVIAPDELLPEVRKSLEVALTARGLTFAVSAFDATANPPPEDELFNLVLIKESLFETGFLHFADNYDSMLARAALIFLIEAADMDLGRLRLRLFSLWQLIEHNRSRLVIQSSSSRDLNSIVSLIAQQGGLGAPEWISLTRSSRRATHVLMLDDCQGLQRELQSKLFAGLPAMLPTAVSLAFESARLDCEPIIHRSALDPLDVVKLEYEWGRAVDALGRNDDLRSNLENADYAIERMSGSRFRAHMSPTDQPATVIGWDTANFLSMRERNYNFFQADAFLVQILSKNYPMRKFLRDFEQKVDEPGQAAQRRIFLPQVPRLAGGVYELAYLVAHAMLRKGGLTRTQFKHILETIPDPRFVDNAGIGNDRSGLEVLLRLHGSDGKAKVDQESDPLTGDKVFHLVTAGGSFDEFDPARVYQGGAEVEGDPLDYSDRGLTFAPHTQVWAGDMILQVSEIKRRAITLTAAGQDVSNLPNIEFINSYRFDLNVEPIVEYSGRTVRLGVEIVTAILHISYQRRTTAMYQYPGGVEPFAGSAVLETKPFGGDDGGDADESWSTVRRNRSCVAHIVVDGISNVRPFGTRIVDAGGASSKQTVPDALSTATVALAVCVILKDTIRSLFPEAAPRIAVLSPQLYQLDERLDQARQNATDSGKAADGDSALLTEDIEAARFLAARAGYYDGCDSDSADGSVFATWAQESLRKRFESRDDVLEFFIVEDSDRDLGVARAIALNTNIFRAAAYFAVDLAAEERVGGSGSYLRFGADRLSRFIYVPGARDLLLKLGGVVDPSAKRAAS
jgi:hypothetical protein